ncbi:MAG TPA: hypothetical protein PKI00_03050 [Candidatus Pacearchaeota archaeon]|nr:hypothetical protein [Candidatus Pacearchaeota archaeon]
MKISIKNVKQQKVVSGKRTLLSLSDGSNLMIRAADYNATTVDYRNKTLIIFEYSSKIQEIIVTKGLSDEFLLTDWPILLKRNKKERFYYDHIIDYYYYLTHYYKGEEIFDYRNECFPQRRLIK